MTPRVQEKKFIILSSLVFALVTLIFFFSALLLTKKNLEQNISGKVNYNALYAVQLLDSPKGLTNEVFNNKIIAKEPLIKGIKITDFQKSQSYGDVNNYNTLFFQNTVDNGGKTYQVTSYIDKSYFQSMLFEQTIVLWLSASFSLILAYFSLRYLFKRYVKQPSRAPIEEIKKDVLTLTSYIDSEPERMALNNINKKLKAKAFLDSKMMSSIIKEVTLVISKSKDENSKLLYMLTKEDENLIKNCQELVKTLELSKNEAEGGSKIKNIILALNKVYEALNNIKQLNQNLPEDKLVKIEKKSFDVIRETDKLDVKGILESYHEVGKGIRSRNKDLGSELSQLEVSINELATELNAPTMARGPELEIGPVDIKEIIENITKPFTSEDKVDILNKKQIDFQFKTEGHVESDRVYIFNGISCIIDLLTRVSGKDIALKIVMDQFNDGIHISFNNLSYVSYEESLYLLKEENFQGIQNSMDIIRKFFSKIQSRVYFSFDERGVARKIEIFIPDLSLHRSLKAS